MEDHERAAMSSAAVNDLPDSAFAYIESGGDKDSEGKTTPRRLRHYPVHDKPHADNAAARAGAAVNGDDSDAKAIAEKALPKIKAAQAKFEKQSNSADPDAEHRAPPTAEDWDVAYGLKNAKTSLARVKADQLADPDHGTDPDDAVVLSAIEDAEAALDKAIVAQSKDGHEDAPARSVSNYATAKRAFSSLIEQPPPLQAELQVRMDPDTEPTLAHFAGYASTTGVPYGVRDWLGEYDETMHPGAFAKTLREQSDVPLLFNHDGIPLASTRSATSVLAEDSRGLRNTAEFDRRDASTNSICVQLQRGVLGKMSFSFRAIKDTWNESYDQRGVSECALYDTSIVTYPANSTTSGELVDAMRSAMGREGRSLWLADSELSVRSALPVFIEHRDQLSGDAEDLLERAVRALAHADELVTRSKGPHGRARTFLVAEAMLELRAGKSLSAKNQGLLQTALDALSAADKTHSKLAKQHQTAAGAVSDVLTGAQDGASQDGQANGTPPGNGNPIMPQDGAGARSAALKLRRAREAELRSLRG